MCSCTTRMRTVWWWLLWCTGAAQGWTAVGAGRNAPGEWGNGLPEFMYSLDQPSDSYTTANLNFTVVAEAGATSTTMIEVLDRDSLANVGIDCSRRPMEGKYGEGHVGIAFGQVVHIESRGPTDDHSGCEKPLIGTRNFPKGPWIALIKRGKCNFDDKVQNAFESKASGVLIYNDRESNTLDKMKLSTLKNRNISAVFTFKSKGEDIATLVDKGVKVMLHITIATHCVRQPNNVNRTSVLFVSISFIVLMVMSLSWLVFYYIQRFRYMNAKDRLSKRLCCAAKKALSKIPVKNLKSEDKEIQGDGECCAVCIELYKISDVLRILPCRHDFHKSCIDPWLLEHRTCPMCKMDILKYYGFVFTGSQESILQLDTEEGDRRTTGVSPLPRQPSRTSSYEIAHSERSSRASSPDELTPSLQPSVPPSTPNEQLQYTKYPPPSMSDSALYSGKRVSPGVHSIPGCSRHPVETTIVSNEHIGDDELRDSV
ncbi:ring finger protein goliath [Arctopsyche grandis]|uniref:ring finger protein goliath n=1 Tax=Arctopsyche grandis TaxID=121162 RepID=UPI00406D8AE8